MIVFDSDILIDVLRSQPEATNAVDRAAANAEMAVSAVSVFELYTGVRTAAERSAVADLLAPAVVIPLTADIAQRAGEIAALLRRSGTPIGSLDAMIAASALSLAASVCTRNTREFGRVTELRIVSPAEL